MTAPFHVVTLWAARVLGLLFFLCMVFMVVGHAFTPDGGLPPLWRGPLDVQLDALALILMTLGGVVGWKWPKVATVMVLGGYAIWQGVERKLPWPPGVIEVPLVIGLLYAFSWWSSARTSSPRGHAVQ
jgi:hypothetical protein